MSSSSSSAAPYFGDTKGAGTTVDVTFGADESPRYALGYWSIRGLGAPLTMMMCAAKVPFTLFLYDIVEKDGGGWTSEYFAAKSGYVEKHDAPLWNLPFCVDREEERCVFQTNAVFAYLGRACGMLGSCDGSTSRCEQLLSEIYDLRCVMTDYAYSGGEDDSAGVVMGGRKHLKKLEAWLELEGKKAKGAVVHLVGGKFSAPDFHLYEMLDQFGALSESSGQGDLLRDYPRLKEFKDGFAALEENQFYLNSWLHKDLPFNNCMARFGSLPGPKTYVHGDSAASADWRGKGAIKMSPSS